MKAVSPSPIICYFCNMKKLQIVGCTLSELEGIVSSMGCKSQFAKDLCVSIYRRRVSSFDEIKSLPLALRQRLTEGFTILALSPERVQSSADGTVKYLFRTLDGHPFESAYMPSRKRNTLCVSTQSGCRMGCKFCHTGTLGLQSNLSAGDIIGQLLGAKHSVDVNRIVLMGMGEPLDNTKEVLKALEIITSEWGLAFGAANITLSTVGILPEIEEIIRSKRCNLAVSMHSPWPMIRERLMPIERLHPLSKVLAFLKDNPVKKPLRLSFEYMVIPGINDSHQDAAEAARILGGLKSHVNVMPYNSDQYREASVEATKKFRQILAEHGQPATIRLSRGYDISAACGMMVAKG